MRLVQVQPSLSCNLRCLHCYSESSPEKRGAIPLPALDKFLEEARALGYHYVGLSGGEPLLWADWEPFLQTARRLGFATAVVTNGTLITPARARALRDLAGVVAVSVDGPPAEHDAMRGSARSFSRMARGLRVLKEEGVRFVLVFTLTKRNAGQLAWLYEFAVEVGAFAVEIHPLCNFGAATANLPDDIPDSQEFQAASWLLALLSARSGSEAPAIVMDVFRLRDVLASGWPLLPGVDSAKGEFSDLVPSLIVEPDGCVSPFIYGFPRPWAVGSVGAGSLLRTTTAWRGRCAAPVAELVRQTLDRLSRAGEDYVDLLGEILFSGHNGN